MAKIRTSCPTRDNKYYIQVSGGGYNKCITGNPNNPYTPRPSLYSVLPNCVGYCYGRYLEYWDLKAANLPTCNAKDWFSTCKKNGFKCTQTPSVGSIICFAGTTYGHIAFVERIEANGDLFLSESNWSHQIFRNVTVRKADGYNYSIGLKFVGFIANPKAKTEPAKKTYKTGEYIVDVPADSLLYVRTGPGTSYKYKKFSELSANAQAQILKYAKVKKDGYVKGMECTVSEVKNNWGKTPSGWICLDYCKKK